MTIDGYHGFLIEMEIKLLLLVFNWQILICPLFRRSTTNVINAKKSKLGREFLKKLDIAIRSHFCV